MPEAFQRQYQIAPEQQSYEIYDQSKVGYLNLGMNAKLQPCQDWPVAKQLKVDV